MDLFEQSFLNIYTFGTQNFEFMMDVLQCNIIQQLLCILDGLVPFSKDIEDKAMSLAGSNEGIENGGVGNSGGAGYRCRFHKTHYCCEITIGYHT